MGLGGVGMTKWAASSGGHRYHIVTHDGFALCNRYLRMYGMGFSEEFMLEEMESARCKRCLKLDGRTERGDVLHSGASS